MPEPIENVTVGQLEDFLVAALRKRFALVPGGDMLLGLVKPVLIHALELLAEKFHVVPKGDGP